MAREVEFTVCGPAGQEIGKFRLDSASPCASLKLQIEQKVGPPPATQQIVIGDRTLEDVDPLLLEAGSHADSVHVTLLLRFPAGESKLEASWKALPGAGGLLEELHISEEHKAAVLPDRRVHTCGLDPDSGLLLLMRESGEIRGYIPMKGENGKVTIVPSTESAKGKGEYGMPTTGLPSTASAKDRRSCLSESEDDFGKGKAQGKFIKGKPGWKRRYREPGSLIMLRSEGKPVEVPLDVDHPLHWDAEILAVEAVQGFPIPSFGVAVARVFVGASKVHLISMELCPAVIKWQRLSASGTRCEAACLDRENLRTIFVQAGPAGRDVVFTELRTVKASEQVDKFPLSGDSSDKAVSSIAWSSASSSSVLLTFVGEHAVRVYQKTGSEWLATMTLGDPLRRGCVDGEADQLMFWFPKCDDFDGELTYSRPLIAGPSGAVFVHSGGVLMRLAANLSSAIKATSMREELWMLDDDEGTPEYPCPYNVVGVHNDKMYRPLRQTDYREGLLVRRLQLSPDLRQGRSRIRDTAPALWPSINENRVRDAAFVDNPDLYLCARALRPARYYEEDRDRWDGNPRWLGDGWLWQNTEIPEDVRIRRGRLIDFAEWRQLKQFEEEYLKGGKAGRGKRGGYQEAQEDPAKELRYRNLFENECRGLSESST
ncbi:Rad54b [Symbiodinium natans]|uniref:Rad54b protein n=1 Tax=Symbiodinium natans TaxID=878477 RepID=A0A812QNA0_9DINO|nr:Rad54b [Symbiodinium natans]